MLLPFVGIVQQQGQRNAMCENSRINWAGIQESLQTKLDRFFAYAQGYAHRVTQGATYEQTV